MSESKLTNLRHLIHCQLFLGLVQQETLQFLVVVLFTLDVAHKIGESQNEPEDANRHIVQTEGQNAYYHEYYPQERCPVRRYPEHSAVCFVLTCS